jgi:hypothetical protein
VQLKLILTLNESKPFAEKKQTIWREATTFKHYKLLACTFSGFSYHAF